MATIAAMRVLAHQGGWDEILMVLAPLLVLAGLLALARRRVEEIDQGEPTAGSTEPTTDDRERADPA